MPQRPTVANRFQLISTLKRKSANSKAENKIDKVISVKNNHVSLMVDLMGKPVMNNLPVRFNMAKETNDPDVVSQKLLRLIGVWLEEAGAYTTEVQQQMLEFHVKSMVMRAKTKEPLPEVDYSLFDEISPESIALAAQVVESLPGLAVEEVYLLSVHFEIARSNP